jgi:RHS repeat-associated protein
VLGLQTYDETEEYRYDALGRRIWRRLERPDALCPKMDKASGCLSVVERTVWDGDQVLAEIRADGGLQSSATAMECDGGCPISRPALEGRVLYTTGAGFDHPVDVIRLDWYNDVIVPVYSWRGRAVDGICVNSSQFCSEFTWPARTESATFEDPPVTDPQYGGPVAWAGNIMDTQKDGSGLVYKRNRYYDPASGRFTQVDPIGLGGGLSAYGFATGDPINFADPSGDTVVVNPDARGIVGQCLKSTICKAQYDSLNASSKYYEVDSAGAGACGSDKNGLVAVGCEDTMPVAGHGAGGHIKIIPDDFWGAGLFARARINNLTAVTHELAHVNTDGKPKCPRGSEKCAIEIENAARKEAHMDPRPQP